VPQNESEFTRVLRGYDASEVDRSVNKLRRELLALKTDHDEQTETINALTAQLEEAYETAEQLGRPTFSGLGARLASTLSIAEEHAARLFARAEADAQNLSIAATREAEQLRGEASSDARRIRESANAAAEQTLTDAQNQAKVIISDAENYASGLRKDAEGAAREIRGESATEISNARSTAKRQIEQQQAESRRQIAEAQLVLVAKRPEDVDISEEIMNILKLQADTAARIDDAEAEFLTRQQEAVALTQKYIDDAQVQVALSRRNAAVRESAALKVEQDALEMARVISQEAAERASAVSEEAEKRASALVNDAKKSAAATLAKAKADADDLRVEQEAVSTYFEGLRYVLAQATDVKPKTRPSRTVTS
jgi:cell division septum initiation protein DivIVA